MIVQLCTHQTSSPRMVMQLIFLTGLCATPLPSFGVANDRFVINGTQPVSLRAGSIHYSRVHPDLWDDRLSRLRALGLNAVTTYVPWNFHEAEPGAFDFSSPSRDLPSFLRLAQRHRLHVLLRAHTRAAVAGPVRGRRAALAVLRDS